MQHEIDAPNKIVSGRSCMSCRWCRDRCLRLKTKTRQHLAVPYSNGGWVVSCLWPIKVLWAKVSWIHFHIGQSYQPKPLFHLPRFLLTLLKHMAGLLPLCSSQDFRKAHQVRQHYILTDRALMKGEGRTNLTCFPMMYHPKSGFGTASLSFGSNEITTYSLLDF